MSGHINTLAHYTFMLPDDIPQGKLRKLNFNLNNELSA